jgi:hypothetical protein
VYQGSLSVHYIYNTTSLNLLLLSRAVAAVAFCLEQVLTTTSSHHLCEKPGQTTFRRLSVATRSAASSARSQALGLPCAGRQQLDLQVHNSKEWTPTAPHGAWWCRKMVHKLSTLHHAGGMLNLPGQRFSMFADKLQPAAACAEQEASATMSGATHQVYTELEVMQVSLRAGCCAELCLQEPGRCAEVHVAPG